MTYIDLMLAWDMMAGLGGLKISHLSTIRLFLEDGAETASLRGEPCKNETFWHYSDP